MDATLLLPRIYALYAFAWGAAWGSFLNVVIWRLPRGENLAHPPSRCPGCGSGIRWFDNLPILSWFILRGKCRACGNRISARYPTVEAIGGLLSLALWFHVAEGRVLTEPIQVLGLAFLLLFFFAMVLVAIAFIDLDLTIIPHSLTFPAMAWGLAGAVLRPKTGAWGTFFPAPDLATAAIGLVAGGLVIYLVFAGHRRVTGRVGMGGGDATMLAAIGANLGWQSLLFVLMFASLQGLATALGLFAYERLSGRSTAGAPGGLIRGAHHPEFWDGETPDKPAELPATPVVPDPAGAASAQPPSAGSPSAGSPEGPGATAEAESDEGFLRLALPFGPFLALAALEYIFVGERVIGWLTGGYYP